MPLSFEATIWKGRRWSAANAYLRPALKRENCTLVRAFASDNERVKGAFAVARDLAEKVVAAEKAAKAKKASA